MFYKKFLVLCSIFTVSFSTVNFASASVDKQATFQMGASSFGPGEVMFAQEMIPHHQQAIQMSKFALINSTNPKVLSLARNIINAQASEIVRMNRWLKVASAGMASGMDMGMQGMLTEQQLKVLGKLKGSKFDRLYLTEMIFHHKGALKSVSIIANSRNAEAKALSLSISSTQSAEISKMQSILATIK